jgi:hypothetical protein
LTHARTKKTSCIFHWSRCDCVVCFAIGSYLIDFYTIYLMLIYLDLNVETNSTSSCAMFFYEYVNYRRDGPSDLLLVNISWEMNEKFEWKSRRSSIFFSFFFVYFLLAPRLLLFCFITTAASALCFRYFVAFAPCYTVHGAWKMVPSRNYNKKKTQ